MCPYQPVRRRPEALPPPSGWQRSFFVCVRLRARPRYRPPRPPPAGPRAQVREIHAAERPGGDPPRGPQAPDRRRERLVPRRLEEREAGAHRLRAPLRAHDVPGLGERPTSDYFTLARGGRREPQGGVNGSTNKDRTNYFETCPRTTSRSRLWLEADRMGFLLDGDDPGEARQPARRGEERAAPGLRQPAVRPGRELLRRRALSRRATPTPGRSSAPWRTSSAASLDDVRSSSAPTTRRTTPRSSSPATSIRRSPRSWSRSTSVASRRAGRSTRPKVAAGRARRRKLRDRDRVPQERVY